MIPASRAKSTDEPFGEGVGETPSPDWLDRELALILEELRKPRVSTIEVLKEWLLGRNLPAIVEREGTIRPSELILGGISASPHRQDLMDQIIHAAVLLLDEVMSDETDLVRPEKSFIELLALTAGLGDPERLGGAVRGVFERIEKGFRRRPDAQLDGELRRWLRSSLIANQYDESLATVWKMMYGGQPHPVLAGDMYSGYQGVLRMPSKGVLGEPSLTAIGDALRHLGSAIRGTPDRRIRFQSYLDDWRDSFVEPIKDITYIRVAHESNWEDWQVLCLDNLVVLVVEHSAIAGARPVLYLWSPIAECLPYPTDERLCGGTVARVAVPKDIPAGLITLFRQWDEMRKQMSYPSQKALKGLRMAVLDEVALYCRCASGESESMLARIGMLADREHRSLLRLAGHKVSG